MSVDLPGYYFRIRENGALCFRVETERSQGRIDLDPIAVINLRNGRVKPQGDRELSSQDLAEIDAWITERTDLLASREIDDIHSAIDTLNLTAHWAQTRATHEQLEDVTDALLLAMHDLRSVLVRKKVDRRKRDDC